MYRVGFLNNQHRHPISISSLSGNTVIVGADRGDTIRTLKEFIASNTQVFLGTSTNISYRNITLIDQSTGVALGDNTQIDIPIADNILVFNQPCVIAPGSDQRGQNFTNTDFSGSDLTGVLFSGADLSGCNFTGAIMNGIVFSGDDDGFGDANLTGAIFIDAILSRAYFGHNNRETNFSGADLRGAYLREVDFTGSNLERADLTGARIARTNFTNANLNGTIFMRTNLRDSNIFDGANLQDANLEGANQAQYTKSAFWEPRLY